MKSILPFRHYTQPMSHSAYLWIVCFILLCVPQLSCSKRLKNVFPLGKTYYNETTIYKDLKQIEQNKPDIAALHVIGTTLKESKPIYALQIQTDMNRIPVLIVGQHHGDEVVGVEIAMALAKQLVNYADSTQEKQLLDIYSFWIIVIHIFF